MQITNSAYQRHPTNIVFHTNPKKKKKISTRHFTMGMICTTQHNHDILLKNEKQTWKYVKHASFDQYQQHPFNKLNKINSTHIRTTHFSNLNNNSKIKKSKVINMKCFKKNRKPIPFLEVWSRDDEENWRIFVRNTVSLWERWMDKTMNSQNEQGKTDFFYLFNKLSLNRKTHNFCDWNESRTSHQNPWEKNWKNLSKCFSWLEVPPASQSRGEPRNLLSNLRYWNFH